MSGAASTVGEESQPSYGAQPCPFSLVSGIG